MMMNPLTRRLVTMLILAFIFISSYLLINVVISALVYFFGLEMAATIFLWVVCLLLLWVLAGILES